MMTGIDELCKPDLALQRALDKHQLWLGSNGDQGQQLNVENVGWKWSGLNLRGACFRLAEMECSEFTGSDLAGADFSGANVSGSYFNRADIRGTRFDEADISHCSFNEATRDAATSFGNAVKVMTTFTEADTERQLDFINKYPSLETL